MLAAAFDSHPSMMIFPDLFFVFNFQISENNSPLRQYPAML